MNTPSVGLCILIGDFMGNAKVVPRKTEISKGKMFVVQLTKNSNWKWDFSGSEVKFSLMDFVFPITVL